MSRPRPLIAVLRKIVVTVVVGVLSFPLTNLLFDSLAARLVGAMIVGVIALVIQFLIDIELRLAMVESEKGTNDVVTELAERAAAMDAGGSPLLSGFVEIELRKMSRLLHALSASQESYEGEDREWLLALTRSATTSIDGITLLNQDRTTGRLDPGMWATDLGQRHLSLQREAAVRGVRIRRIFIVEQPELKDDPDLLAICQSHSSAGVEVRVLAWETGRERASAGDFVLFDAALSGEVVHAPPPLPPSTRLVLHRQQVGERIARFQQLWELGNPPYEETTIYTSADDGVRLRDAMVEMLDVAGFEVVELGAPVRGSWFQRLSLRRRDSAAMEKLSQLAGKLERAAELKYIDTPRSETDEREAKAIALLAEAMAGMDEVVIRTSHVLFVKTGGRLVSWVLTEAEIRMLHENPQYMRSPRELMAALEKTPLRELTRPACCPTCGHAPVADHELTGTWLHPDPGRPSQVVQRQHCQRCQPHDARPVVCPLCGDGPMLAGGLEPAGPVRGWLVDQGWRQQADLGLVCPVHVEN